MVLAAEITSIALARTLTPPTSPVVGSPVVGAPVAAASSSVVGHLPDAPDRARHAISVADGPSRPASDLATSARTRPAEPLRAAVATTQPRTGGTDGPRATYRGANRVWIPALGINKAIRSFSCSRSRPPDAGVYRWGCAGRNNVYLLGHAWSTFKPIHDAYVGGRLRTGMKVIYADGGGSVHTYSVVWWKVVKPTTSASWAWASLSRPSMTLQTCVGANSAYRLMVRLVRVG
jgi:hypothetical protein